MRFRQGRHNDRNLYIQMGDGPSDSDEYLAAFIRPADAALACLVMNGDRQRDPAGGLFSVSGYFLFRRGAQAGVVFDPLRGEHMAAVLNGEAPPPGAR